MTPLDALLGDLLMLTLAIKQSVEEEDSEPEEWIVLLERRQAIMDQLSLHIQAGAIMTEGQHEAYLRPIKIADEQIAPNIEQKKAALELKMNNIQKSRAANKQYGESVNAYTPYGAFFDKKK